MNLLSFFLLYLFKLLIVFFGKGLIGELDFTSAFNMIASVASTLYNIFAWVNVFIDVDFLLFLFSVTMVYYTLKFFLSICKLVIEFFI